MKYEIIILTNRMKLLNPDKSNQKQKNDAVLFQFSRYPQFLIGISAIMKCLSFSIIQTQLFVNCKCKNTKKTSNAQTGNSSEKKFFSRETTKKCAAISTIAAHSPLKILYLLSLWLIPP